MHEKSHLYGAVTAGACYLVPWTSMLLALLLIQKAISSERKRERKANRLAVLPETSKK